MSTSLVKPVPLEQANMQTRNWAFAEIASPAKPSPELRAALIGRGIQQSRTPRMHEAEGVRLGLRYTYGLLDFDYLLLDDSRLAEVIDAAGAGGFIGLNVTYPFKQSVIPLLDELSPNAAAIGAVNTVTFRNGRKVGHNTDCWGFAESFRRGMPEAPIREVVQLGAGGAGVAVSRALLELGTRRLAIVDPDHTRASGLAETLSAEFGAGRAVSRAEAELELRAADGLVNASPVGMAKYPGTPVPRQNLHRGLWVADIVYFPAETELLRAARQLGCRTLPGMGMAVFQAVRAFELFTGLAPDPAEMARHVGPE
jgi:shikimate dehydrogenase